MEFKETPFPGLIVIQPRVFADARGFFMETYHREKFRAAGIDVEFVQDNHSRSCFGTLRGLHFQDPHAQGKLVRVIQGEVYDVAVDLRRESPMFGKWYALVLSADNKTMMYVPPGFAHGFCVTSESAEFVYSCTNFYTPTAEGGIIWSDPTLNIPWPVKDPIISPKDLALSRFRN